MKAARVDSSVADALSAKKEVALGLIIGVISEGYACIYHQVYTPPTVVPLPDTLGGILKTALDDSGANYADWLLEHSRQVSKLLPAGLQVLGLFVTEAEPALMELRSTSKLLQPLTQLLAELCAELTLSFALLYLANSKHQSICRLFEGTQPRLVELTTVALPDLVDFQCSVPISLAYCGETRTTQVALQALLEQWGEELKYTRVHVASANRLDKVTMIGRRDLSLYSRRHALLQRKGNPVCIIKGMIDCRLSVSPDLKVADLEVLLKIDLLKSLRVRLELLDPDQILVRSNLSQSVMPLPRRILHRAHKNLLFCDYLVPGESFDSSISRLQELAGVTSLAIEHLEERQEVTVVLPKAKPSIWLAVLAAGIAVLLALVAAYESNILV